VSIDFIDPPDFRQAGMTTYEYVNIAVDPNVPSKPKSYPQSQRRADAGLSS